MKQIIIKRYNLDDVLSNNKKLYNVNNLWVNDRPADYEEKIKNKNTGNWINLFHDNIKTVTITKSDLNWMNQAFDIGGITGIFPKSYSDELDETCKKLVFPEPDKSYFIRTEYVSLKYGQYGPGPYKNIKSILSSLVTSKHNHACIRSGDDTCKIYFIDWIENYDDEREFRVFISGNEINAISIQNLYGVNAWLNSLTENQIIIIITDLINFFNDNIKEKLLFLTDYTMDIYYSIENKWYFIEPNCFGAEYAAGSALFHWQHDYDVLNGITNYLFFPNNNNSIFLFFTNL